MSSTPPSFLHQLVGEWTTQATHPASPGLVVRGSACGEWLEGEHFLLFRARTDHPDFPDSTSILGFAGRDRMESGSNPNGDVNQRLTMHYFDSRGVFRVYETDFDDDAWHLSRTAPGFSQRFVGRFTDEGTTIVGLWQSCTDDVHWQDDLQITYRRTPRRIE